MKVAVVIPTYNEEKDIVKCLLSVMDQTHPIDIVVVDDGSTDHTVTKIRELRMGTSNIQLFTQSHCGPAAARNWGASKIQADIYVFIDADMTIDSRFVEVLVKPIEEGKTNGTFTKEEYVANWENVWARCWNINQGIYQKRRIPWNYPDKAPVFRAILAREFNKVGGFTEGIGYTDDWTLSKKLHYQATVTAAICFHNNPDSLRDVFQQAQWIGRNEFLNKSILRRLLNLFRYSFINAIIIGFIKSTIAQTPAFLIFKLVYDAGVTSGIISNLSGSRNK